MFSFENFSILFFKKLFPQMQDIMVKPLQDAFNRYQEMKNQEEINKK